MLFFFFKQKTAYEMRISDWSSDVCSSDLIGSPHVPICSPSNEILSSFDFVCNRDLAVQDRLCLHRYSTEFHAEFSGRHGLRQSSSEELRVGKECVIKCRSRWHSSH